MNIFNKVVLVGLLISGMALVTGFLFQNQIGFVLGHAAFFGWVFGVLSIIGFLIGMYMYLAGRLVDYWATLYPINFGLTLLGGALISYHPDLPMPWILITVVLAIGISFFLRAINLVSSKWIFIPLLIPLFFINIYFWTVLAVGSLFLGIWTATYFQKTAR